jgi:peptide deformylase
MPPPLDQQHAHPDPQSLVLRTHPDPVLRRKAAPVSDFSSYLRTVIDRMFRIMREEKGIGLAAPQVGLSQRLFVLHVPRRSDDEPHPSGLPTGVDAPMVFINPVLTLPRGSGVVPYEEGCLSLPGIRGDVLRPDTVYVKALDATGRPFELHAAGLLARCIQHETDHLDGVMIIDKMTPTARMKNRFALRDLEG